MLRLPFRISAWVFCALTCASSAVAQDVPSTEPPTAQEAAPADESSEAPAVERTDLNLLGEVDAASGEARRNENVQIDLIDNNVLKEMNKRVGVTATVVETFTPDRTYFGSEFGGSPSSPSAIVYSPARDWHASGFWLHDNSIFRARSFFQVGDVQPARTNEYGFDGSIPLWRGASFVVNGQQTRSRGQVNGNVLIPKLDERTPLTTDPDLRAAVQRLLDAYPLVAPNRTDINERALNTNAPQFIDNDVLSGALHQAVGQDDHFTARYAFTGQEVDAFQLVAGQNPNSSTKNHDSRVTWTRTWSPRTETDVTFGFDRTGSLLTPDESSYGPTVMTGDLFETLGPGSNIPIDRAQNRFRYAGTWRRVGARHTFTAGAELWRRQVNGSESDANRGQFSFRSDFGNDTVTNIRMGLPSTYIELVGLTHRGFRQSHIQYFAGDDWRVNGRLTLNLGLRYQIFTEPKEVNGLADLPYGCDCDDVAPRFGFAYRAGDRWGVLRGAYGMQYGEIFAVTYGNSRFNPPYSLRIRVATPDFLDPLAGVDRANFDPTAQHTFFDFSPDLGAPYSHQYNFSWQLPLAKGWRADLGYVGSRTWKLLTLWYFNRGAVSPDLPQTTATVEERRPDQRYSDVRRALNGGRGYYDAAKATLLAPSAGGFTFETSYWFSKAIDLGTSYTGTAAGEDAREGRGQSEFDVHNDMKSVSNFDQPHAWLTRLTYQTPGLSALPRHVRPFLSKWEIFAVLLVKTGTPFSIEAGSDGPGYGNVDGSGSDRPNIVDAAILGRKVKHPDISRALLPRAAFSFIQPTDERGNIGRNTFRKDGIQNLNLALSRTWSVGSDARLTLRAESNNLLNRPQFAEPGLALANPNFGQITNTLNDGRTVRFLLRLGF